MTERDFTYQFYQTTTAAWDAMYEAIMAAKKTIYWEIYIFVDDFIGNRFLEALAQKARAGVEVRIIIDAFGSSQFSEAAEKYFTEAGVDIKKYNRILPDFNLNSWVTRLFHRNHRKVLIIDEQTVFLGGVNIADKFHNWDDIYLRLVGPIAWPLLRGFAKSYISAGGKRAVVRHLLGPRPPSEDKLPWREKLRFITHSPTRYQIPKIKQLYRTAIDNAKETVNFLSPYYVPDKQFLRAIALARKRGVKVNIFLPLRPDHKLMELIARTYYSLTARLGANLYLLPNMHHGKAMSVDSNLGMVGSINLTPRSFSKQEESAVSFNDVEMVADLNALFNGLKSSAVPFDPAKWKQRGIWQRIREWVAKWFEEYV